MMSVVLYNFIQRHVVFIAAFPYCIVFFKQKTAYEMRISDWSSDVCSSDLKTRPKPGSAMRCVRSSASTGDGCGSKVKAGNAIGALGESCGIILVRACFWVEAFYG